MESGYEELARAQSERGVLVLRRSGGGAETVIELRANGIFVMDSQETSTERALATTALERSGRPRDVLVAGLGLGYTLATVLADRRVRRCTVVEIEPALVRWFRDGTVPHGPALMADDRVTVEITDIADSVAAAAPASRDLVLLDVDNGPGYLVHEDNAGLYDRPFLRALRHLLRPGGILTVWSAAEAPALEASLASVFTTVETQRLPVRLRGRTDEADAYWLYLAFNEAEG
ncbi:MAG: spermidine synthase [Nocardioides sp.]